jgi:hypothetical protein
VNPFPDPINLQDAGMRGSSRLFRLTHYFRYHSPKWGQITIPTGFLTDGASIPRIFWNILSPFGDYFAAALVHDYLYSPANHWFTRAESDQIFLEAMTLARVPWLRRHTIHKAVRLGGWRSFKGLKKQ